MDTCLVCNASGSLLGETCPLCDGDKNFCKAENVTGCEMGKGDINNSCNPFEVQGSVNYDKLVDEFGCERIDGALIKRFEKLTGKPAHLLLRRGMFYTHRDLTALLDDYERGVPFYLYTGRGASSESLHVGHLMSFFFTKYLQDAFNVPVVIQLTDDEKFYYKEKVTLEEAQRLAHLNAKDIIACGFCPDKTFIFTDTGYMGTMYPVVAKAAKMITFNQCHAVLGDNIMANIGRVFYPSIQAAPAFPGSFPMMFGTRKDIRCLIPQGIDQDPFFRLCRSIAPRMGESKPACIHCKFFPAMEGPNSKMSSSSTAPSTIFMTDTPKLIAKKVNKYAFSGGQETRELQEKLGANLDVDVPYQYLRHIMEDDLRLEQIGQDYANGKLMTGELKKICIDELVKIVENHQEAMRHITDETVRHFMDPTRQSLKAFSMNNLRI
eukprot:TRINITY_DN77135_c0_g1_i1.p1 TRINITY_DN77135_c0_g1~~TRINITY_DN77135_c0_g1_i1.p1  ORF type:complete len:436 (-),score=89.96 TRINITY_DN77135_c0_g1_i1:176-1483(-)